MINPPRNEPEHHAKIVVFGLPDMSAARVKKVAAWLRKTADALEKNPEQYARRFVARLMK